MRYESVKKHLKPYGIHRRRATTINHAFAAAIAPHDAYDAAQTLEAVAALGQKPDRDLECVYCGGTAETWDHVFATVRGGGFSGHGHRLGNLVPCCKPCNSSKGNQDWTRFLERKGEPPLGPRYAQIAAYLGAFGVTDPIHVQSEDHAEMIRIRDQVLELFKQADLVAARIRARATS